MTTSTPEPSSSGYKRRRLDAPASPTPNYGIDDNDDYEPYVPVAQRRQAKLARASTGQKKLVETIEDVQPSPDDEAERQKEIERKERTLLMEAQEVHRKKAAEGKSSLLSQWIVKKVDLFSHTDAKKTDAEKHDEEDAAILAAIASKRKLASDLELAQGIQYTKPIETTYVSYLLLHWKKNFNGPSQMESSAVYTESTTWHR